MKLRLYVTASGLIEVDLPDDVAEALIAKFDEDGMLELEDVPHVDWEEVTNTLNFDVEQIV